ncbi:hypothetical protein O4328_41545 [Rhodococcus opacus]|uniref:Uncharacterized protein n=1 Tax=Rhodococcus opacus TaxID=37919 RepID=A0AAX3Y5H1_RHOOP|nr:hypothetical protein [Rhodococcus opacus]MCZ4590044.1 hypothetical protein [Rhodococcus opacus]WLF44567.1 hypothetical protein Q5707_21695 [Rhodococcus opacus]
MVGFFNSRGEQVLTATSIARQGMHLVSSDLPDAWVNALGRVGRDLNVRQYGGVVERIDWVAEYETDSGYVLLLSDVTVLGRGPGGLGMSGSAAQVDDEKESVVVCIADLVQDQVARAHVAWQWGDTGWSHDPSPRRCRRGLVRQRPPKSDRQPLTAIPNRDDERISV